MTTQYILKHKNGTFQYIVKYINNNTFYYKDREMTILHREDGPAVEWRSGGKEWFINGTRHREDGPAICGSHGYKCWYINGKRHRVDGPAQIYENGDKAWYINGEEVTEEQHEKLTKKEPTILIEGKSFTVEELKALIAKATI